jgi:hypothetical protein
VGLIDTEGRRGLRYADKTKFPSFNYKYLEFLPPFASDRFSEAIAAMYATGVKTIIIDSLSLEHEGAGGYLEYHVAELDRMAGNDYKKREKMTFTARIKPAAARRRLINSFLQVPVNFIFCFRAKEKLKIVTGGAPIPLGWQAIAGDEFVYEMIARCLLPPGAKGVPDWSDAAFAHGTAKRDDQDRALFPDGTQLSEEIGRNIALTYSGKDVRPRQTAEAKASTAGTQDAEGADLQSAGDEVARKGVVAVRTWWQNLTPRQQNLVTKTYLDDVLKPAAESADKEMFGE